MPSLYQNLRDCGMSVDSQGWIAEKRLSSVRDGKPVLPTMRFGSKELTMPRIPYVEKEAATGEVKKIYDGFEQQFQIRGGVPNVVKALANSPGLAARVFPLANYFMTQSPLEPRLRELAVLILMKRLDSEYGFVRHIEIAQRAGLTREQIDAIGSYQSSPLFTDNDKLVLRYAEDLTMKAKVDDDLFARVEKLIGRQSILELTAATAFWNMMARNLNALQVGLE
jgi:alkylhydroperoxidase family enzyme